MIRKIIMFLTFVPLFVSAGTQIDSDLALKMLQEQDKHFEKRVICMLRLDFTAPIRQ